LFFLLFIAFLCGRIGFPKSVPTSDPKIMALPELLWVKRIAVDAQGFPTAEGGEFHAEFSQRKI
jgi:hypothetical protein